MKVGGAVVELMMRSPPPREGSSQGYGANRVGRAAVGEVDHTISLAEAAPTNERASEQQHKKEGAALSSVVSAQ
jgi:hypothetical protein